MRNGYSVKLEIWMTKVLAGDERHLDYCITELETRHSSFEDAKVQFARLDLGACCKRRDNEGLAALKSVWYRGSCIAFDSYDIEDLRREAALEALGGFELDEVELEFEDAGLDEAVGAHTARRRR